MDRYVTGSVIRRLRESKNMTQEGLAQKLHVSSKAVSKWETGQGLPDVSLLEPLAQALDISVIELFSGENIRNQNRAGNMLRERFYVCPVCGNVIQASGEAVISCCGITLPPLEAEDPDEEHLLRIEEVEDEYFDGIGVVPEEDPEAVGPAGAHGPGGGVGHVAQLGGDPADPLGGLPADVLRAVEGLADRGGGAAAFLRDHSDRHLSTLPPPQFLNRFRNAIICSLPEVVNKLSTFSPY